MAVDNHTVERFLFHEARLMDAHRLDEWLALWDDDATHSVAWHGAPIDPPPPLSVIDDRRGQLRNRIQRIKETLWLTEQAPRLRRIVGNIEIESESPTEIVVGSNFILGEF